MRKKGYLILVLTEIEKAKFWRYTVHKASEKWLSKYMNNYRNILVGEFDTDEEAKIALKNACLNTLVKSQGTE